MILVPGILLVLFFFPGVIVHEMAHQVFCRLFRVAVHEVNYFTFETNPAGYVVHERPRYPYQGVLISVGPFFVNSILAALIAFPAAIPEWLGDKTFLEGVLLWLGVSIGSFAFPSTGDAKSLSHEVWSRPSSVVTRLVTIPLVAVIYIGSIGSFIWLNFIYGVGVAIGLPIGIVYLFA
jgi:hypothetical protein